MGVQDGEVPSQQGACFHTDSPRWGQKHPERDRETEMQQIPCPALPLAGAPHTSAPSHTKDLGCITLRPTEKEEEAPRRAASCRQGMCEKAAPRRLLQRGGWRWLGERPPAQGCPPTPQPGPPMLRQPVPPAPLGFWPFSGLRLPPVWGTSRGKHIPHCVTSLHGLPRGPGCSPPPLPSPLTMFILISSLAPLENPPPGCPTDALQMGARQPARAQPLPALGFLQPGPARAL